MRCKHDSCSVVVKTPSKTGLCRKHWVALSRKIPVNRHADYWWLQSQGMTKDEALAHIAAGLPCERKIRVPTIGHKKVSTAEAVRLASDALEVSSRDVLSRCRFDFVVDCRAVVVQVMALQGASYAEIGRRINRDHSSVIGLVRTFPKRVEKRPELGNVVEAIMARAA